FSCGAGIDATVVEKVDAKPKLKSKAGPYFYSWSAMTSYYRSYARNPVRLKTTIDGVEHDGVTVLAQNSDPFTYFGKQPIHVCDDVSIDDGKLGMIVLKRANQLDVLSVIPRLLSSRFSATKHKQVESFPQMTEATIRSGSEDDSGDVRPFPVQVDGDYIGLYEEVTLKVAPKALTIIS
ncbi:MAG: hypothetical protein WBW44_11145, partial [Solirubrobacterales bacterium]